MTRDRHLDEFLAPVRAAFRRDPDVDAEAVARAVLATLSEGIDSGEVRKVMSVLPRELRTLWPEEATRGVVM